MTRLQFLITLCAVCIGWIVWDSQVLVKEEQELIVKQSKEHNQSLQVRPINALSLQPREIIATQADLFDLPMIKQTKAAKTIVQKPYKQQQTRQVAPLPFTYIGKWQESGLLTVLIEHQGQVLAVKQGDVLNAQYKVLAIDDGAESIVVTFESLTDKTQQRLIGKG